MYPLPLRAFGKTVKATDYGDDSMIFATFNCWSCLPFIYEFQTIKL